MNSLLALTAVCLCGGYVESKTLPTRTGCPEGYVLWPVDLTCHRPFSQGPCLSYQQLINHREGPFCQNIQRDDSPAGTWSLGAVFNTKLEKRSGWKIPYNKTKFDDREQTCLSVGQIYWPDDGQCYDLLTAGPCQSAEWLVLEEDEYGDDRTVCKKRVCPCDSSRPDFCEVEVREGDCRCKVALAAAQDGLCDPGEQLLLDPYGFGVCGCINSPPHAAWPVNSRCYPLYTQGPCEAGYQYVLSPTRLEPSCSPSMCPNERSVLWEDGECYPLGEQGPCQLLELLTIDELTFQPKCFLMESRVKRVFDLIPGGFITDGPVYIGLKARNCILDLQGKCKNSFRSESQVSRKRGNTLHIRERSSKNYMEWLKQFKTAK